MFRELTDQTPDLVLLHHYWQGVTISQLLERIADQTPETRIIVFTGRSVDVSELIACVRFGVADYWTKRGDLDPIWVFRQISHYCSNPAWTIGKLRMPSGSLIQLLQQAETSITEINVLTNLRDKLQAKVATMESQERRAVWKAVATSMKFMLNTAALTVAFIIVNKYTKLPNWGSLVFIAIVAVFFLLLEGKLAEALIKWEGGQAKVTSS